jgi:hypothetical protein
MKVRIIIISVLCLILLAACLSCSKQKSSDKTPAASKNPPWNRQIADLEYRQLQTELSLAEAKELYLVIDLRRMELALKLKGATVWEQPLTLLDSDDSSIIGDFTQQFESNNGQLVRHLAGKYLFSAGKRTPDSILAIVSEAVSVNPELLQRDMPARFQLRWNDGLILDIRTDVIGKYKKESLKNAFEQVKHVINKPFGEAILEIKMDPDAALTLYRASKKGLPTMIYPPM